MKKKPYLFQILGDTLFFLPHLVDVPISWSKKIGVLTTYAKLTLFLPIFSILKKVRRQKALSFHINYFDYRTFHLLFRAIFIRNDYFFRATTESPLILDCGANIGFATLYFKWLYPGSEIHVFEPEPSTFQLLQKNISENGLLNVTCHQVAVSSMDGEADFYFDRAMPGYIQMSLLPRTFKDSVKVPTISLPRYIRESLGDREIDYMKLDLEGAEADVVRDLAQSGCLRQAKEIFVEFHHRIGNSSSALAEFVRVFEENGFDYYIDTFYTNRFVEDRFQCLNVFATRRDIA